MIARSTAGTEDDDATLLAASRAGAIDAFGRIVERYHNLVCAVAYSKTGDRVLSEDVGQETFLVAWKQLASLREPEKLGSWLCGIARNLGHKAIRRRRHEEVADVHEMKVAGGGAGPLEAVLSREMEAVVWKALEQLPDRYREPLILFYREEQSIAQVARGLGLSEQTARQRLSRGRLSLKEGVAEIVERTLEGGRPSKETTAAVLLALAASAGVAAAASSVATRSPASRPASSAWKYAGAVGVIGALLCAGVGLTVVASRSTDSPPATPTAPGSARDPRVLADLRRAREAWRASAGAAGAGPCDLHGTVQRADGSPAPGALVAVLDQTAAAFDPTVVRSDERGAWRIGSRPAGAYMLSVTAPGQRAAARVVRCAGSGSEEQRVSLETGGTLLRGAVSDIGGGPVADVTVWVLGEQAVADGQGFAARSGADGTYELLVPRGLYTVVMVHPEYTLDVRPVAIGDSPAREDFTLVPGASVEGTVVGADGRPIAGARVSATGAPAGSKTPARWTLASGFAAMLPVVAGEDGRFALHGLPPGIVRITAHAEAFATADPRPIDLSIAEQKSGVTVSLGRAFAIAGFVVRRGDERRGVDGVRVAAQRIGPAVETPLVATTDGSGHFRIAGAAPGRYRLIAVGPSSPPLILDDAASVVDRDLEDVLLAVEPGGALRGRVDPPGPVSVRLESVSSDTTASGPVAGLGASLTRADVDERGNFDFPAVAAGRYVVTASSYDREGRLQVTVPATGTDGLVVPMQARPSIAGQVVVDGGAPLPGALVVAQPKGPARQRIAFPYSAARTDEQGRFRIIGSEPGPHELRVFHGVGQRPWSRAADKELFEPRIVDVPAAGPVNASLEVAGGGKPVRGIVVDAAGAPVADAWVKVRPRRASSFPPLHEGSPILTDTAGRFSVEGLAGGELEAEATGPRGGKRSARRRFAAGEEVTLELRPVSTLTGRVSLGSEPVPEFDVEIRQDGTAFFEWERGQRGELRVPDMVAGTYKVEVRSEVGYAATSIVVGPDATTSVELPLMPWASVRGRVVVGGRPLGGAAVMVMRGSLKMDRADAMLGRSGPTDGDGAFQVDKLIAGSGELMVVRSEDSPVPIAHVDFEARAGQTIDLGVIDRMSPQEETTSSASDDLGLRFFLGAAPPTAAQLAAIDADPPLAYRDREDARAQVWIADVRAGSPAMAAGLRRGDRVISVGMRTIRDRKGGGRRDDVVLDVVALEGARGPLGRHPRRRRAAPRRDCPPMSAAATIGEPTFPLSNGTRRSGDAARSRS